MPGKLKVRVIAGRDLPVMDRASERADAFVELKFGNTTYKTDVYRKSLNPQWNSEWYKFEVDDEELQDEPLQIRIMDYDTYSAHDAIGKLYIDLNPLLWKDGVVGISGWFPIYDTMHGIRGEINVAIRVELFTDANKFRESSCGVKFFCSSCVPFNYTAAAIYGFVEELVVNDDPEYQWIDKIRTPRSSNEARQRLFSQLSGELQRKIGLKVLEMGGNAVIGYNQCFDLEGESGIVVRGIGTAVCLIKSSLMVSSPSSASPSRDPLREMWEFSRRKFPLTEDTETASPSSPTTTSPTKLSESPTKAVPCVTRRASDSDITGTPTKGGSLASSGSGSGPTKSAVPVVPIVPQSSIDMLEYPFFSINHFPSGFLVHLGGMVTARSVKLLDRIHNPGRLFLSDEPETRDAWWTEIRTEIRSHANAMGCHAVVGYRETTSICDEICVLSASGTAAVINLQTDAQQQAVYQKGLLTMSLDRKEFEKEKGHMKETQSSSQDGANADDTSGETLFKCSLCHIPYKENSLPFPVSMAKCCKCGLSSVPDILFTTIQPPHELEILGKGCLLQARICRTKRKAQGEANAALVSDALPFMEYELHRQLMSKLKVKGMNTIFDLRVQVNVGETLLVGVATGTAVYLSALPPPTLLRVTSKGVTPNTGKHISDVQKKIVDTTTKNRDFYGVNPPETIGDSPESPRVQNNGDVEPVDDVTEINLSSGTKETFVLEIDDTEDEGIVSLILDPEIPKGFDLCSTEVYPGNKALSKQLQMFSVVYRQTFNLLETPNNRKLADIFDKLIKMACFKLRSMVPCCVCDLHFDVRIPEDDQIQIWLTAAVASVEKRSYEQQLTGKAPSDSDLQFTMEELSDQSSHIPFTGKSKAHKLPRLERRMQYIKDSAVYRPVVEITPLCYVPGATIDRYMGNINLYFIRESTSVREVGGVSGFMHSFVSEVQAMIRSHVLALGGNAIVAYDMIECVLSENPHKNQCQCLINVTGDAVRVIHDLELPSFSEEESMETCKTETIPENIHEKDSKEP
ncbi:C2 domain-containing protein 5-like isoform X2 [Ptychodera flava]|uniref:C2 domain-containing protein 5-like isoform X2 n=1 Tax=Ptychodera flava TaxID=63121 RepID=UPI00396A56AC